MSWSPTNSSDAMDRQTPALMKRPFRSEDSPLHVRDAPDETFLKCPLLRQVRLILEKTGSSAKGLLLTGKGQLPTSMRWELYHLGKPEQKVDCRPRKTLLEKSTWSMSVAFEACRQCRLVTRNGSRLLLTESGRKALASPRELFIILMQKFCTDFRWGYRVGHDILPHVHDGCAAIILSLLENAGMPQTVHYYRTVFTRVYRPELEADLPAVPGTEDDELDYRISLYVFRRFLWLMGLVDVSSGTYYYDDGLMTVTASELLIELLSIRQKDVSLHA